MEFQFQQQKHISFPAAHTHKASGIPISSKGKLKGSRSRSNNTNKFVGVRQRPSGRWVAEIKHTTQKIRMRLGTFETAEEAARAYDEAACLLRGNNTRTNFITHVSLDSPLASRIQNLLNTKKLGPNCKQHQTGSSSTASHPPTSKSTSSISTTTSSTSSGSGSDTTTLSSEVSNQESHHQLSDDVYKPDLSDCNQPFDQWSTATCSSYRSNVSWVDGFSFAQQVFDFPKDETTANLSADEAADSDDLLEFERMKVERQISASLYAMNGVQEYMDTVNDANEALWIFSHCVLCEPYLLLINLHTHACHYGSILIFISLSLSLILVTFFHSL